MTLNKIKLVEICFFFYLCKIKTQLKKKPSLANFTLELAIPTRLAPQTLQTPATNQEIHSKR